MENNSNSNDQQKKIASYWKKLHAKLEDIPANLQMNEYYAEPAMAKLKTKLYPELLEAISDYVSEIFMAYDTNCGPEQSFEIAKTIIKRFCRLRLVQIRIFALKAIDGDFINDNNYYLTRPKLLNWLRSFCGNEEERERQFQEMLILKQRNRDRKPEKYHPPKELLDEIRSKIEKIGKG